MEHCFEMGKAALYYSCLTQSLFWLGSGIYLTLTQFYRIS